MDAARWLTERGFGKPGDFGDEFADDIPQIVTFKIANPNDDFEDA